ncbi:TPA: phosphoribosylformylglycinamidine synthase subunit PurS [archaeon]|uniref:Phosphoribosylformylglycinamidine synthase subunit PurS n=1 Tax=Candidatus Naiadarchaeum limnaeum TaxID=2756139 RepID=A0A832UZG4_9ARCH|nr:phosphoribosylformylglycinamidine synthase subunit PurS [Candidatus Naiadarchaeales archaeon SRR2090153.bin1042]HIK00139.1 phosphoribosylformylglycinamidine synthase subunit PurS [Candidatus Naiadarchaeum limnaeum]
MVFKAEVRVELKRGILDAEANTVQNSLQLLGFKGIGEVKTAKIFVIDVSAPTKEKAQEEVEEACKRLLANPVINNYSITIK